MLTDPADQQALRVWQADEVEMPLEGRVPVSSAASPA